MRRLIALSLISLMSCWNFETLQDKGVNNNQDMTMALADAGMVACRAPNLALTENCSDGIDNNDDCLVDCNDPLCSGALNCVDPMKQLIGYGSKVGAGGTCSQTATDVFSGAPTPLADCSAGCGCLGTCNSALHAFANIGVCMMAGGAESFAKIPVSSNGAAPPQCQPMNVAGMLSNLAFSLENITTACAVDPAKNKGKLASTLNGTDRLCTQPAGLLDTVQKIANTSALCLAFTGDIACPSLFPTKTTWYQNVTDGRTCTCACANGLNSCQFAGAGTVAKVSTAAMCGGMATNLSAPTGCTATVGTEISVAFQVAPVCTASGTAPTDAAAAALIVPGGKVTTCCK